MRHDGTRHSVDQPANELGAPVFGRKRTTKPPRAISEKRFEAIARIEARKIKRIETLDVVGYTINATVRTITGIGTWQFSLDFDQNGYVTGGYHVWSENDESSIPQELAKSISKAIQTYLLESDGQPDKITSDVPLEIAIEIEIVRQEGVAIVQKAEDEAQRIRDASKTDAEQALARARQEAEATNIAAKEFYESTVSSARKDAESIRQQAMDEAAAIKADAEQIALERRQMRARRRAFIANHKKAFLGICVCLMLALSFAIVAVRNSVQARLAAKLIPVGIESSDCIGAQYKEIESKLAISGFTNISCIATADLNANDLEKEGTTRFVTIDGRGNFHLDDQFPYDAKVDVYYLTAMELRAPLSSQRATGMDVGSVEASFTDAGFANVRTEAIKDVVLGLMEKPNVVSSVTVNGEENYSPNDTLRPDAEIVIYYHDYRWAN